MFQFIYQAQVVLIYMVLYWPTFRLKVLNHLFLYVGVTVFPQQSRLRTVLARQCALQSEAKPKPIVTRSHSFPALYASFNVFASSFDWFSGLHVQFVIGQNE